jgi:hypothetical protein
MLYNWDSNSITKPAISKCSVSHLRRWLRSSPAEDIRIKTAPSFFQLVNIFTALIIHPHIREFPT